MIRQCATCKKKMGEKPPLADTSVTHGICDPCLKKALQKNPPVEWSPDSAFHGGKSRLVGPLVQTIAKQGSIYTLMQRTAKGVRKAKQFQTEIEALAMAGIDAAKALTKSNPGEAWHAGKMEEAEQSERQVKKPSLKDFYHGKSVAHFESALEERARARHNPVSGYRVSRRGGRWKYFTSLDEARAYAGEIERRTGVIAAVEAVPSKTVRPNPIGIFGLGNPPKEIRAKIEGIVYHRCLEVKAEKTGSWNKGYWRHPFAKKSKVQILALDNGDLLLHSVAGIRLWKTG